jgi:hypothetical protein
MKRMQIVFTDEAWTVVETTLAQATENFDTGSISTSDVVNELVLHSRIDIKALQTRHTDLRRSLKAYASKEDIDIDQLIKTLTELKGKSGKKKSQESEAKNG